MNTKLHIGCIGDLTADVYMPQGDIRLGGAALNMAMWAKRLGADATIFSAAGVDAAGRAFAKKMKEEGLSTKGFQRKRGQTSSIEIFVTNTGERRYGKWNPGALTGFHLRPQEKKLLRTMDALAVTVYPPYVHILTELKRMPFTIINYGDLHENDMRVVEANLRGADALIFGLDKDADEERINAIRRLAWQRNILAIVTLGKYGAVAWHNGESYVQAARDVKVLDTTGAGDAFLAAFLVSYLTTDDIQKSLKAGSDTAANVIQKVGAY